MTKKKFESLAPGRQAKKNGRHMPDADIDFSDIPQSTEKELRRAKRVGCTKKPVNSLESSHEF